jgi:glycerol kinase
VEGLARTVPDSDGVVFVPALTGLGRTALGPRRRGAGARHHPRHHPAPPRPATLDAIAHEVRDVVDA